MDSVSASRMLIVENEKKLVVWSYKNTTFSVGT